MRFGTKAIHAGQPPDPLTGAIMVPVYLSTTFNQEEPGKHKGYDYSRTKNPTRSALESCLAELEGGKYGLAFASGCAATDCVMHLFKKGDHLVCMDEMYGGTFRLFERVFRNLGLGFSYVDMREPGALEEAINEGTKGVWIETPTNPLLKIVDLSAVGDICRKRGLISIVDNTFMTPYFQRPLEFGIDIVLHSTTKYLNGHSDVIGGAIITSDDEIAERLYFLQNAVGGVQSPMDSFLVLRGLKTLHIRMERHEENAMEIARYLVTLPEVEKVIYPGLPSHPQHELARRQMSGFGGMVSFYLRGGLSNAIPFLKNLRIISLAESLGGVESLIEHPSIMTHSSMPEERREALGISGGMIRLSAGIESVEDLKEDIERSLHSLSDRSV